MGLRFWLGRAGAGAFNLLIQFGAFTVGPLPGVHYHDPDPDHTPQEDRLPGATHAPHGSGGRPQGPSAGHPERRCTTPPSRVEQELWAGLGIDVKRTGR
ncbi:DUF6059 family protein [Streptomyces sp. NBC_01217]|uniref:DUF6059 family protein n=1 Tax=Streptomyces sp. NBC_01217 TaxID=2903779 RepID=UPI002E142772|nr:hypothetical protein OG507_34765 [Streptomyces sp. NBC_01217]